MSFQDDYASMLRGMLSPSWQKPSERKIEVLLKKIEDSSHAAKPEACLPSEQPSLANRRRLTELITATIKLDAAARLIKEATINVAASGLLPVEIREEAQKIAADLAEYIQRRLTSTIEHIP